MYKTEFLKQGYKMRELITENFKKKYNSNI